MYLEIVLLSLTILLFIWIQLLNGNASDNEKIIIMKYLSGKLTGTFVISFIIALNFTEIITNKTFKIDNLIIALTTLVFYILSFSIIKFLEKKQKLIVDKDTILFKSKKFQFIFIILSLVTIVILYLMKD
ncbi:MAG: hypothetical protein K0B10_15880 [Vicingaceae bacterium]|nr:hypothetical protein [Vicingaceae bacterium]